MRFYYTTSQGEGYEQKQATLSLGGYQSSSGVPNDYFNNLFGDITSFTIDKNQSEYIAMMLVNETGNDATNLQLYFTFPSDSYSKYQVGAVVPTQDSEGVDIIERVENINARPFDPTFVDANGVGGAVSLGNLLNGAKLGIWIKRDLLPDAISEDYNNRLSKEGKIYVEAELNKEDIIPVTLTWD
jgi:hypothetical protein